MTESKSSLSTSLRGETTLSSPQTVRAFSFSQSSPVKPKLPALLREALRSRHYSRRTGSTYCNWVKRYIYFHKVRHPKFIYFLIFTIFIFFPLISTADPLDNWHWRNPLPQGNDLNGIIYGNGTFVAIGRSGTILTSPNGITWTTRTSGTSYDLNGITHGNNTFVVVGGQRGDNNSVGVILTSPDGVTWSKKNLDIYAKLNSVTYGNNAFVAVGDSGKIITSVDGIKWEGRYSNSYYELYGVSYGNSTFVVVGNRVAGQPLGVILTSADGINWTVKSSLETPRWLYGVTYENNTFVAVGDSGKIVTSTDGISWTLQNSGVSDRLNGIIYGNNTFVAVGGQKIPGSKDIILTSTDTLNWIERSSITYRGLNGITYGNNVFVAVGDNGTLLSSPDGIIWTIRTSGTFSGLYGVTYDNNIFVAVGGDTILTSEDGVTWTERSSGTSYGLYGIAYGKNIFVVVGQFGMILTSQDGITWTTRVSGTSYRLNSVTYGNNTFVAVGYGGTILTSSDGTIWTTRASGTSNTLNSVTYGNNTFIAVGDQDRILQKHTILTSQDGIDWKLRDSGLNILLSNSLNGLTYGNGIFMAVGVNGRTITSQDGITWIRRLAPASHSLNGITYGNNTFVAVGYGGTILTTPDGTTWTAINSGTYGELKGITYGKYTYVAVGVIGGTILQSDTVFQTILSGKPPTLANNSTANFIFSINVADPSFECQLDNGSFTPCSSPMNYIGLADSSHIFIVKATVEGIPESTPPSYTWTVDTTPPTGSLTINEGAETTNNATVTLTLNATDDKVVAQMRFSNDSINWSTPEIYALTKTWALTSGDGIKTIYVEFLDMAGNWSDAYKSSIILDTTPPVTTVNPASGLFNTSQSVTIITNESAVIYYTLDGSSPASDSTVYNNPIDITVTTTLKYFAKDSSGNSETVKTFTYIIDTKPPTGSITINGGATRTNDPAVTLALSANDTHGVAWMQFSNDNANWSIPEAYATTKVWTLTSGDGIKTVYVKYEDNAGNWSQSYSATITLVHLTSITITSLKTTVIATRSVQVTAMGTYSDGYTADLTSSVIWNSSNKAAGDFGLVAGAFLAIAEGITSLSASTEGITSNIIVMTVAPLVAKFIELTMIPDTNIIAGSVVSIMALIKDAEGVKIEAQSANAVTFTKISGEGILGTPTVDNGNVQVIFTTAPIVETAVVQISTGQAPSQQKSITTIPGPAHHLTISPPIVSLKQGQTQTFTTKLWDKNGNKVDFTEQTINQLIITTDIGTIGTKTSVSGNVTAIYKAPEVIPQQIMATVQALLSDLIGDSATVTLQICIPGDVTADDSVGFQDALVAFQVTVGTTFVRSLQICADVDGDNKISLQEVIYILQKVSGLRQ